jgi:hypothetical protein
MSSQYARLKRNGAGCGGSKTNGRRSGADFDAFGSSGVGRFGPARKLPQIAQEPSGRSAAPQTEHVEFICLEEVWVASNLSNQLIVHIQDIDPVRRVAHMSDRVPT